MKRFLFFSLLTAVVCITNFVQATQYQFVLKSGTTLQGTPLSNTSESITIQTDSQINSQTDGNSKELQYTELTSITAVTQSSSEQSSSEQSNAEQNPIRVLLSDGSRILVKDVLLESGQATLNFGDVQLTVPESQLVAVRFNLAEAQNESWVELLKSESQNDLLIVEKNGKLSYHRGHVLGITAEKIPFVLDGSTLPVARTKAFGIRLIRSFTAPTATELATGATQSGSVWSIGSLEVKDGTVTAVSRLGHKIAIGTYPNEIQSVTFSSEPEFYLSDLEPESWTWTPFVTASGMPDSILKQFNKPKQNENFGNALLITDNQKFTKGLSIRSKTELVFRLPQNFSKLSAVVGIDDTVRPKGSVELEIFADDKSVFKTTVNGTESAKAIEVPLTGAKRVRIVVDFGADASVGDVLIIGSPRLWE